MLGRALTGLTLKADLARRLVILDPPRALVELSELAELACAQDTETAAVTEVDG